MLVAGLRAKAVERVDRAGSLRGRTIELVGGSHGVRERMKDDLADILLRFLAGSGSLLTER